jgi:hypothetical protein
LAQAWPNRAEYQMKLRKKPTTVQTSKGVMLKGMSGTAVLQKAGEFQGD